MTTNQACVKKIRDNNKEAAIVFIHGFSGHFEKTWGLFPYLLGMDIRLTEWDIFSIGYSTSLSPDIRGIWSSDPSLKQLSGLLQTYIDQLPLSKYKCYAVIAHSMGGLVVQHALLEKETLIEKMSHIILFGTPSNGLKKASPFSFYKKQVRDMVENCDFIKNLREKWTNRLQTVDDYNFVFRTIGGETDDFVPSATSLDPFPETFRRIVPGNHLEIVKPGESNSPSVQEVLAVLTDDEPPGSAWNSAKVAVEMKEFQDAIRIFKPHVENLDESSLVQYALALEETGNQDEAINILKKFHNNQTDAMGVLAGRLKRKWIAEHDGQSAEKAQNLYKSALEISKEANDIEQCFYHGINVAFLELTYQKKPENAKASARAVLDYCKDAKKQDHWYYATMAESHLYLEDIAKAVEYYEIALKKDPSPRQISSMYLQAFRICDFLQNDIYTNNINDVFKGRQS